jgi:hypothetical protein
MDENPYQAPEGIEKPERPQPPRVDRWTSVQWGGLWFTVLGALGFVVGGVLLGVDLESRIVRLFARTLMALCPLFGIAGVLMWLTATIMEYISRSRR